ncbi:MAG TPA: restriction endonuclease subunit S [bacterium]|nr:restriction endonuclease subunit S [bacterium]HPN44852.1 restriction endonuclease subunit S [bacterium]
MAAINLHTLYKHRPCPAYKNSGIDWLGKIPVHWITLKLKRIANISYGIGTELDRTISTGIPIISLPNVLIDGNLNLQEVAFSGIIEENIEKSLILQNGDLLFNWRNGSSEHVGKTAVFYSNDKYTHVSFLLRIRFDYTLYSSNYFHQFINNLRYTGFFKSVKAGVNNTFNQSELRELYVICPPLPEQNAIAAFLDHETARLDALIEKKQRLIDLLREKRAALITRAVTKGLNPAAPMKDSGIEWLGEIPEGWEVKKVKYIALVNNKELPELTYQDFEFQYIDISSVDNIGNYISNTLTFKEAPSRARRCVKIGDTILSTVRTYLKAISFITNNADTIIVSTGFAVFQPIYLFPKYLFRLAQSEYFIQKVVALSNGVSYPAITPFELKNIKIPIPPYLEQRAIAEYLDYETAKIDNLVGKIQASIEKLQEYRAALISAAVTGKIDVREMVE